MENIPIYGLEKLLLLKYPYYPHDLQIKCYSHQNSRGILYRNSKNNLKIHMGLQKTLHGQSNVEKEESSWKYHTFWFQNILQSYNQISIVLA